MLDNGVARDNSPRGRSRQWEQGGGWGRWMGWVGNGDLCPRSRAKIPTPMAEG